MTDDLQHFGVKGMRWGFRKDRTKGYSKDNLRMKSERPGRPSIRKSGSKDNSQEKSEHPGRQKMNNGASEAHKFILKHGKKIAFTTAAVAFGAAYMANRRTQAMLKDTLTNILEKDWPEEDLWVPVKDQTIPKF